MISITYNGLGVLWVTLPTRLSNTAPHVCAIDSLSNLWCWGNNANSQLGDGAIVPSYVPKRVNTTAVQSWNSVTVGNAYTCAIRSDYRLFCWVRSGRIGGGGAD